MIKYAKFELTETDDMNIFIAEENAKRCLENFVLWAN